VDIFVIIIGVIAFFAVKYYLAKRRSDAMGLLAQKLGLNFDREHNYQMAERHQFLDTLDQGSERYAFNVISGDFKGFPVKAFDFHYETYTYSKGWRRRTHHHHFSFFILTLEKNFPELSVAREYGLFSRILQALGRDDIDFASHEFSKRYEVRCRDKKFAYDFCNAQMIDYLLGHPVIPIEVEQTSLAIGFDSRLQVERIEANLNHLLKIRTLMPGYLFAS
jgi:hypothetical protein